MKVIARSNGSIAGVVVLFVALMFTSVIQAQPGFRSPDGRRIGAGLRGIVFGLRDLDLTDVQREVIWDIAAKNRSEGRAMAEQLVAARAALNEVVMDDVVNESIIRARASDVASLEAEGAVYRAHLRAQIRQVLTPDQRAELRQRQDEVSHRVGERRGRRKGRR
jgi:Spy/CpxP family protein refolding chaperone